MQNNNRSKLVFIATVAIAAIFVGFSSLALPEVAASHFGGAGVANGFMPRSMYIAIMVGIILFLPVMLVYLPTKVMRAPGAKLNLPHKEYWLAPERKEEAIDYLCNSMRWLASSTVCFLAYVHWLVLKANTVSPPQLDNVWFLAGMGIFLAVTGVVVVGIFRYFGKVPK